jgi:hypothetical protein
MTRTANARVAGSMFLLYIVIGIAAMIIDPNAGAVDVAGKLEHISAHQARVRAAMMLGFPTAFIAFALGIGLYGLTRDEDHELALFALICRTAEGIGVVAPTFATLGLLSLATQNDQAASIPIADLLVRVSSWNFIVSATFFAVGSTIFCWLLLRGRMIPMWLAWLGVVASVVLIVGLPLQLAGVLHGITAQLIWIPMAAFEIPAGVWLLIKGAAPSVHR